MEKKENGMKDKRNGSEDKENGIKSKGNNLSHRISKSNRNLYIWIFCLTLITAISTIFCFYNWSKICSGNLKIEFKSDEGFINILLSVSGFLAAFSAISIYSIFNANIDGEKRKIEDLRLLYENEIKSLQSRMSEFENEMGKTKDDISASNDILDKFKKETSASNQELNDLINNNMRLMDLVSPHSTAFKKRDAIRHFTSWTGVNEETKEYINNFFTTLGDEEKTKSYYIELETLLTHWGKLIKTKN